MLPQRHVWLLAIVTIAAAYLSYRELAARSGFIGGLMVGLLLCSLLLIWREIWKARKS